MLSVVCVMPDPLTAFLDAVRGRRARRQFDAKKHHASCKLGDINLTYACDNCGHVENAEQVDIDLARLEGLVRVGQALAEDVQHMLTCDDEECLPPGQSLQDYVRDALA